MTDRQDRGEPPAFRSLRDVQNWATAHQRGDDQMHNNLDARHNKLEAMMLWALLGIAGTLGTTVLSLLLHAADKAS